VGFIFGKLEMQNEKFKIGLRPHPLSYGFSISPSPFYGEGFTLKGT
jgi:hypothetical protein